MSAAPAEPVWTGQLVPVPAGPDSCPNCHGPRPPARDRCRGCAALAERFGPLGTDAVVPIAVAVTGGALAGALWRYKAGPPGERAAVRRSLSALLGCWLTGHGACVGNGRAVTGWVPGRTSGDQLRHLAAGAGFPVQPLLAWQRGGLAVPAPATVHGAPVLLLDDTWASGATATSGAVALKRAGATSVTVLVLGRHVGLGDPGAPRYLRQLQGQAFRWDRCCRCPAPAQPAGCW